MIFSIHRLPNNQAQGDPNFPPHPDQKGPWHPHATPHQTKTNIDFNYVLSVFKLRRKYILSLAGIMAFGAVIGHFLQLPVFVGSSALTIQHNRQVSAADFFATSQGYADFGIAEEVEKYMRFLKSERFNIALTQALMFDDNFSRLNLTPPKSISVMSQDFWDRYLGKSVDEKLNAETMRVENLAPLVGSLLTVSTDHRNTLYIRATTLDDHTSMIIANVAAKEFVRMTSEHDSSELQEIEKFIREKLETTREKLRKSEIALIDFKRQNTVIASNVETRGHSDRLKQTETRIEQVRLEYLENKKLADYYNNSLNNSAVDNVEKQVASFKLEEIRKKNRKLKLQIDSFNASKKRILGKMSDIPAAEQKLLKLQRNVEMEYELYTSLKQKLNELEIQRFSLKKRVRIDQLSGPGFAQSQVNIWLKLLFSLLVGGFFGGVISLLFEVLDPHVKTMQDLEHAHISVLGEVPHLAVADKLKKVPPNKLQVMPLTPLLVTRNKPNSLESMAFKYIRTRIQRMHTLEGNPVKSITVTSPSTGDGKSFFSANLAISLAQVGKKTVLIDCDFRKPSLPRYFNFTNRMGLASLLTMSAYLDEVVIRSGPENLAIIPSGLGVDHPTELISDERFPLLMDHLQNEYDYVIVDSPPAHAVVDATILASLTQAVIVVSSYRKTKKESLLYTHRNIIEVSHKRVHGVLNNVDQMAFLLPYAGYSHYSDQEDGQPAFASQRGNSQLGATGTDGKSPDFSNMISSLEKKKKRK